MALLIIFWFSDKSKGCCSQRGSKRVDKEKIEKFSPIQRGKEDKTHLLEEKQTLPKPRTEKNEIRIYGGLRCLSRMLRTSLWKWISKSDQWPCKLLKYTLPSPTPSCPRLRRLLPKLKAPSSNFTVNEKLDITHYSNLYGIFSHIQIEISRYYMWNEVFYLQTESEQIINHLSCDYNGKINLT